MKYLFFTTIIYFFVTSVYAESAWQVIGEDQEALLEVDGNSVQVKSARITILQRNTSKKIDSVLYFVLSMAKSDCLSTYGTIRYEPIGGKGQSGEWVWIKGERNMASNLAKNLCDAVERR